jgi:hypothetical protein
LVVDAAAETIEGVGGEDDGATVGQAFQDHLDVARVGVCRIEFK